MLGPTMRARLKPPELSAIASSRSSVPTRSMISDCRAGISNAASVPPNRARVSSEWMVIVARPGEPPESDASISISDWAIVTDA